MRTFRYRLIGTNIRNRLPSALDGKSVEENPDPRLRDAYLKIYNSVCDTKSPMTLPISVIEKKRPVELMTCIWPLAKNGRDVDMLLCCREEIDEDDDRWSKIAQTLSQFSKI